MRFRQLVIFLFSILLLSSFVSASYTLYDDFEDNLDNWTSTNDPVISGVEKYEGSNSVQIDGVGASKDYISGVINGFPSSGAWVLSYWVFFDNTVVDDVEADFTDGGTRVFKLSAGYPNTGNWGYEAGGWTNTGYSSNSGDTNIKNNWNNVKILFDQDNQNFSVMVGSTTIISNQAFSGGTAFDKIEGMGATTSSDLMYVDYMEFWDYDVYGWEYSDAPPTPTFSQSSTATDTDPETEDTSTLLNLSIQWTCENCNATGTDTTIDGISGNLTYNGTLYTPTVTSSSYGVNGSVDLQVNLTTPIFDINNTQLNYIWRYELTNGTSNPNPTYIPSNQTGTQNIIFKYPRINITATNTLSGSTINNFTTNITGTNYFNSLTTTTGNNLHIINATTINQTYTMIIDGEGFATTNNTQNITINNTNYDLHQVSFELYESESVYIYIYKELTDTPLNDSVVSIEFISDLQSLNTSTDNGSLFVSGLTAGEYIIRYNSDNYNERSYHLLSITEKSYQGLNLYLLNSSAATNLTVTVYDNIGTEIENAYIKMLRYYLTPNSYKNVEISKTNVEGKAHLSAQLNTEFHKFIVVYEGITYLTTNPSYITSDTLTLRIPTSDISVGESIKKINDMTYSLSFNNNTNNFKFTWSDDNNEVNRVCLKVYKDTVSTRQHLNTTCVNSTAATILINTPGLNGTTYSADAEAYFSSGTYVDTLSYSFTFGQEVIGNLGVFLMIFLVITIGFIAVWNVNVSIIMVVLSLIVGRAIGLITLGLTPLMALIGVAALIILINKS